jgi:hypothetical protein
MLTYKKEYFNSPWNWMVGDCARVPAAGATHVS